MKPESAILISLFSRLLDESEFFAIKLFFTIIYKWYAFIAELLSPLLLTEEI